jgi:hypothetical protein
LFGRLLAVALLASMIALPAGNAAAQVDPVSVVSDVVTFSGTTNGLTPVLWSGGSGTYQFSSSVCDIVSDIGVTESVTGEVGSCSFDTWGNHYNSRSCGTGNAWGNVTITAEGSNPYATGSYGIVFVAGQGVVTGSGSEVDSGPVQLAGVVTLTPGPDFPANPPPDGVCTSSFTASGVATLLEGPTQP